VNPEGRLADQLNALRRFYLGVSTLPEKPCGKEHRNGGCR
jgi:hypothetical protein